MNFHPEAHHNGEKAYGFRYLPYNAVVENTMATRQNGRWLYHRAPTLHWKYSRELSDKIDRKIEIQEPGNFQIVVVSPPGNGHDYSVDLFYKELANNPLGENPVAEYKMSPYGKDVEVDVKILSEKVPETVFIVSSPIKEEDFVLINRIASKYKKFPGVKKVVLVSPFMGGLREDKNAKIDEKTGEIIYTGQSITAASNIELLAQNIDKIICFEPHSSATQTWAAENKMSFAPISLWKLMVNKYEKYLNELGEKFNPNDYAFIRPDKGRNIGALRIQEFLNIKNKINFEKDRDANGNTTFKDLTSDQINNIKNKNLLLYDDEGATFGTMTGVINKIIEAKAGVKSITIMLGHARFADGFYDKNGKAHSGWKENINKIIKMANSQNPPIKIKFFVSDSREALGDVYSYSKEHINLIDFVSVVPLIRRVIENEINPKNFWGKNSEFRDVLIQAMTKQEEDEEEDL